jgi:hypothetical protein
MTNRQVAVLASRIFCVWFAYNAIVSLTFLPNFLSLLQQGSAISTFADRRGAIRAGAGFERSMLMNVLGDLFRLGINTAAAIFFYRCGPGLIRFLTGGVPDEETDAVR